MFTEFGNLLRTLRIYNGEYLKDMASRLGVTPSYLSIVEKGKRNIPEKWLKIIQDNYYVDKNVLTKAFLNSKSEVRIKFGSLGVEKRSLGFLFAKKISGLSESEVKKITNILEKEK